MSAVFSPINKWPEDERPREKLLRDGEHRLSNAELLAILIDTGSRGSSSLDLARLLLSRYRTFSVMFRASAGELKGVPGIGDAKVCRLFAAAELGKRMAEEKSASGGVMISCPADAARMLLPRMRDLKREVFKVICLDSQNRLIRVIEVEEGTVNHASPILREVFQKALEQFSSSIICAHNHPSGNNSPSEEDKRFTETLVAAGRVLQLPVLDHIIIAGDGHFSFADEGLIRPE